MLYEVITGTIRENLLYACEAALHGVEPTEGANMPSLDDQIAALQQSGIFVDVLRFGLNAILKESGDKALTDRIIRVRGNFKQDYGDALADSVEFFDERSYLIFSSVAANLTFGSPSDPEWAGERLARNPAFRAFLDEA